MLEIYVYNVFNEVIMSKSSYRVLGSPVIARMLNTCLSPDPDSLTVDSSSSTTQTPDRLPQPQRRRQLPHQYKSNLQEEREQALRDYKVTIEYKHLKSHAPGGVYLIPSMNNLRHFYGVIFVRRGPFTNGIFKFQLRLPEKYNDVNMWPQITFTSFVYNPYVNPKTGELDIRSAYPEWNPSKHYLVTVLTYLKVNCHKLPRHKTPNADRVLTFSTCPF